VRFFDVLVQRDPIEVEGVGGVFAEVLEQVVAEPGAESQLICQTTDYVVLHPTLGQQSRHRPGRKPRISSYRRSRR